MKKLLFLVLAFAAFSASAQQNYRTPGIPTSSVPLAPTFRLVPGATDSLGTLWLASGNKWFKVLTAVQLKSQYLPASGGTITGPINSSVIQGVNNLTLTSGNSPNTYTTNINGQGMTSNGGATYGFGGSTGQTQLVMAGNYIQFQNNNNTYTWGGLGDGSTAPLSFFRHLQVYQAASAHNDVMNKGTADSLYALKGSTGSVTNALTNGYGTLPFTFNGSAAGVQVTADTTVLKTKTSALADYLNATKPIKVSLATTYDAFGDSFTNANGATVFANGYMPLFSTYIGQAYNNYALSGSGAWSAAGRAYANENLGHTAFTSCMIGFNDLRRGGASNLTHQKLLNGHTAIFVNHFLDTVNYCGSGIARIVESTPSGAWSNNYNAASVGGKSPSTAASIFVNGATLTYTFYGNNLEIGCIGTDGTLYQYGTFTVSIDGTSMGSFNENKQTDGISDGVNDNGRMPFVLIFSGLKDKTHSVVVTTTSSLQTVFDYFGHMKDPSQGTPLVFGQAAHMTSAGYAIAPANATTPIMDAWNASLDSLIHTFPKGYPVYEAFTNNRYDPNTEVSSDNIHPNDQGHRSIAQAFEDAISKLALNPNYQLTTPASSPTFSAATITNNLAAGSMNAGSVFQAKFNPTVSAAAVSAGLNGTLPYLAFYNSSAGTNQKWADMFLDNSGNFFRRVVADNGSSTQSVYEEVRSGVGLSGVEYAAPISIDNGVLTAQTTSAMFQVNDHTNTHGSIPINTLTLGQWNAITKATSLQAYINGSQKPVWYDGTTTRVVLDSARADARYPVGTGFTTGSVIFMGSSALSQDNANFYWDSVNARLGIGVNGANADSKFRVLDGSNSGLRIGYNGTSVNYYDAGTHNFRNGVGTALAAISSSGIKQSYVQTGASTDSLVVHNSASGLLKTLAPIATHSAGYGLAGSSYTPVSPATWAVDTSKMSTLYALKDSLNAHAATIGYGLTYTTSGNTLTADTTGIMATKTYVQNYTYTKAQIPAHAFTFSAAETFQNLLNVNGSYSTGAWGNSSPTAAVGAALNIGASQIITDNTSAASTTYTWGFGNVFKPQTFAATNTGITYTNAATVAIEGNPLAGTNVTISNPLALYVTGGLISAVGGLSTSQNGQFANFFSQGGSAGGNTSAASTPALQFAGSTGASFRVSMYGNSTYTPTSGYNYANTIIGSSPITTAASSTTPWIAQQVIGKFGTVTLGTSATITNSALLYLDDPGTTGASYVYSIYASKGLSSFAHIGGNTAAPTIAAGTGAGTSPTLSVQYATDVAGDIVLTTGTSPTGSNAIICTVMFNQVFQIPPKVILTPASPAAAALSSTGNVFVPGYGVANGTSGSQFVVESPSTALAASTTYVWHYQVIQ